MPSWISRALAVSGLLGCLLVTASATQPAQAVELNWCDEGKTGPCIVSATRDGVDVDRDVYQVTVDRYTGPDALHNTGFTINKAGVTPYGLGADEMGHTFVVTMKTGPVVPRVIDGWGRNGTSQRFHDADGDWAVRVTVHAAHMLMSCEYDAAVGDTTCPATASVDDELRYVVMRVSDAAWYSDVTSERDKLWGLESYSDIQLFWYPPFIAVAPSGTVTMDFLMQNAHAYNDGTPFTGTANMRIPNRVLRGLYGIPDPETMTAGSFATSSTSGSVSSYQEAGDDAWRVDLTGVTFSKQHLRLKRGTITPTRPVITRTKRLTGTTGRVAYTLSTPRGAKVTGYEVRCVSAAGHTVRRSTSTPTSPLTVKDLHRRTAYTCKVRAGSKAGWSTWSLGVKLAARP